VVAAPEEAEPVDALDRAEHEPRPGVGPTGGVEGPDQVRLQGHVPRTVPDVQLLHVDDRVLDVGHRHHVTDGDLAGQVEP
jgi:hypothetical protein